MTAMPFRFSRFAPLVASLVGVSLLACGGSSSTGGPSSVTVISRSTGSVGPIGATVTMTSAGVNPRNVTIAVGQSVTFVNRDTRVHEIASNPHPIHGSCPSIEAGLGQIQPGQSRSTQGFANAGTCSYHDHLDDGNAGFQGTITIQ
jgi:plastocyanin